MPGNTPSTYRRGHQLGLPPSSASPGQMYCTGIPALREGVE